MPDGEREPGPPPLQDGAAAVPDAVAAKDQPAATTAFKRWNAATEQQLLDELAAMPEIGLGISGKDVVKSYIATYRQRNEIAASPGVTEMSPLLEAVPAVRQLPYKNGPVTQLTLKQGRTLDALAHKLRDYLNNAAPQGKDGKRKMTAGLREKMLTELHNKQPEWLRAEAIPALLQLLMPEDTEIRRFLVDLLAEIPGKASTEALARRAVFDLDATARQAAVDALRGRAEDDYRPVFLKALRYPWAPAADHAAEAIVALGQASTIPTLVTLLKEPDPAAPRLVPHNRSVVVTEVVRANHVANCLLCHPPSLTGDEPVLGVDPINILSKSGNATSSSPASGGGWGRASPAASPGGGSSQPLLIRADITFLRQDFSALVPVSQAAADAAPLRLRFDYLLRTREAPGSARSLAAGAQANRRDYPQRDAVLFALRELTGRDAGNSTAAWQELFPGSDDEVEAARLCRKLLRANPLDQEVQLTQLRDGKKLADTLALASAIPQLKGGMQEKARDFLVARLMRMTAATLRDKLQDDDREVRRAAVLAIARKGKSDMVPDLIALLETHDSATSRLVSTSLKELTKHDFDTPATWRNWWDREGKAGHTTEK